MTITRLIIDIIHEEGETETVARSKPTDQAAKYLNAVVLPDKTKVDWYDRHIHDGDDRCNYCRNMAVDGRS